jgi:hypothetical protein
MESTRVETLPAVSLTLRSRSGASRGFFLGILGKKLRFMPFPLLSGERQDLVGEVFELPDVVEVLEDALDERL